ncbi:MAG: hypothetical protein AAB490_01525 [Patescibacteria group bacterium]
MRFICTLLALALALFIGCSNPERDVLIAQQLEHGEGVRICTNLRPPDGGMQMCFDSKISCRDAWVITPTANPEQTEWCIKLAKEQLRTKTAISFTGGAQGAKLWITPLRGSTQPLAEFAFDHTWMVGSVVFDPGNDFVLIGLDQL